MRPSDEYMAWYDDVDFRHLSFITKLHNLKYFHPDSWFPLEVQARREEVA